MTFKLGVFPTRRDFLAATAAVGGAALIADSAKAAPSSRDLDSQTGRLTAYMLMRGALDDRLVVGFVSGRYYGVVDTEIRPLFGVLGVTFARYRAVAGGGYEGVSYEVPFFTDLDSGKVLDHWHNPYTGEDVSVPDSAYPPARIAISADLKLSVLNPPPGLTLTTTILPPLQVADDIWMTEESTSSFQAPGLPKPVHYSELVTMHAKRSDLDRPNTTRVPCQTGFTAVVSWRPWMKMADRPGHMLGNGAGGYGVSIEALPAAWHEAVKARKPQVLLDPGAPLAGLMTADRI